MQVPDNQTTVRRDEWLQLLHHLLKQIEDWSIAQGWSVQRQSKQVHDGDLGEYTAPVLIIRGPGGALYVTPIGLNIIGAKGRVDLEAWPTLNRVKLLRRDDQWHIVTDSNVPIRAPWNAETFVQLVGDLHA